MAGKYKVAALGTGNIWRWAHQQAWVDHPDVEVVAVCDIVEDKAQTVAEELGIDEDRVYTDYKDVLKLDEVDIVDICTPNLWHSKMAVPALKAGKHVFCEKPDAINGKEAQKMKDAADQSGKKLMVMRNNRFNPNTQYMKKFIDAGHMGDVYTGRCGWIRRRGIPGKGGWFTTKELSGGGPLIDLGVHFIDVAVYLMGSPTPVAVSGATYCKFAESDVSDSAHSDFGETKEEGIFDVEDLATGFIRFDNGATLQIEFSWASNIEQEGTFVELRGTKAGCKLRGGMRLGIYGENEAGLFDMEPKLNKTKMNHHALHLHHFIDVLDGKAEPIITNQEGVDMIKILSAMYKSAETGREVKLK